MHRATRRPLSLLAPPALLTALLTGGPPAAAAPADARVPGTGVRLTSVLTHPVPAGWQVTVRTDARVPLRDDLPVLLADGRVLGVAQGSADGRTFRVTTATRPGGDVRLSWSTAAARSGAPAGGADAPALPDAGPAGPALPADPGAAGPHRIRAVDYDLGDEAVTLPSLGHRAELRARAYLPAGARGARPLVLLLHGRHSACYGGEDGPDEVPWPCASGRRPVPSHLGYAATANALASHGYAVVSVSADGVNAWDFDTGDGGQAARGELLLAHLDLLRRWQSQRTGPLAGTTLDLERVGLMGHSRGGEGVVRAYALNEGRARPYGIRALFLLAPTDFARATAPDVALGVLLPYCDGDVGDLQGQHFYDDTRYALAGDRSMRTGLLVMGANHHYFNTEWTPGTSVAPSWDDWGGEPERTCGTDHPGRLSPLEQQAVGRASMAGFFRATIGREARLLPLFDGSGARARSAGRAVVHATYHAPAGSREDVARLDGTLPRGTLTRGLDARACSGTSGGEPGGYPPPPPTPLPPCSDVEPFRSGHWTYSYLAPATPGAAFLRLSWGRRGGSVRFPVPAGDVRRHDALTFRAAPASAGPVDLTVRVTDAAGRRADVAVSEVGKALRPLPPLPYVGRHVQLRTVRIPLSRLAGVDLRRVRTVELVAGRGAPGVALVADLAFQSASVGAADRELLPIVTLGGWPALPEGDAGRRTHRFPVTLSRPAGHPVTVQLGATPLSFAPDLPGAGPVVAAYGQRVTIPAGATRTAIPVRISGNTYFGPQVDVVVAASVPTGALLGRSLVPTTVEEDEPPPTVRLAPASAAEGETLRFPVTLSHPSQLTTGLRVRRVDGTATEGTDYAVPGLHPGEDLIVTVEPGETSGTVDVRALRDGLAEGPETFRLVLDEVFDGTPGEPRSVTGTITGP